jgi:hypothetical protein
MLLNKYFLVTLIVFISLISCVVAQSQPLADINGVPNLNNKHNLSSAANHGGPQAQPVATGGTDRICIFCHTPHSATPGSPLWSRPDPNRGTFKLYAQQLVIKGDLPGAPAGSQGRSKYINDGSEIYPSGASRLCLSCHDGVTAIGILSDGTSIAMQGGQDYVTDNAGGYFIINLDTSHPISFVYNTSVLADINDPLARNGTYQLPANLTVPVPLDGEDKMQCTTCHDPHEDTRADLSYGNLPFWRHQGNATSYEDVCNECHIGANPSFTFPDPLDGTDHTAPDLL